MKRPATPIRKGRGRRKARARQLGQRVERERRARERGAARRARLAPLRATCEAKVRYAHESTAEVEATRQGKYAYRCLVCRGWHLSTKALPPWAVPHVR